LTNSTSKLRADPSGIGSERKFSADTRTS
jgi:hypothetical protein